MESRLYSSEPVAGATVWITGATAGIGEACAWRFAEGGARIVLIGRRNERLDALDAAVRADSHGRVAEAQKLLKLVDGQRADACVIQQHIDAGELPVRTVHKCAAPASRLMLAPYCLLTPSPPAATPRSRTCSSTSRAAARSAWSTWTPS